MSGVQNTMERLAGHLDYPMFIVTVAVGEHRSGCLVGFCTQCSVHPARYAVFISKKNHTHPVALEAEALGVHVVPRGRQDLARLFGEETGDTIDKFELCEWSTKAHGTPVLESSKDWFVGRVLQKVDGGDHTGFIIEPVEAAAEGDSFLPFSAAKDFEPGHEA